jgi:peptidoglycan/xylan/chitin deacetylase (PgdA/CDA1 family)
MNRSLRGPDGRLTASLSLDLDNLWSYKKTHGDADWVDLPSYLPVVVPRLIEVFGEADLKATVFIVGQDAELDRDRGEGVLRDIVSAGHEVGNHSFSHEPWLHLFEQAKLEEEIDRTTAGVLEVTGVQPTGFRGPGYSLSRPLLDHLQRRGYDYDASTLPTWIGPLARAYYFRSAGLTTEQREQRAGLFGSSRDVLRAQRPYEWDLGQNGTLMEIPVTVWPFARVPFHLSYVLQLHGINPKLAWAYVDAATRMCRRVGLGPSILLHPLDLLGPDDAPGLEFFPGMGLKGSDKVAVARRLLALLGERFDLVPMGVHARRLAQAGAMKVRPPVRLSPAD